MKQHTTLLKEQIKELGREIDNVITYGNTTLREELYKVTPLFEGSILKSVMKQLDVETTVDIPLNTVINYQLGIKASNSFEYLDFGNYIVYKSEKQEDTKTYKLTCYDKMLYSMKQNEDLGITYPITIKNYLNAIGAKIGLTVKDTAFNNRSIQIPEERYLGQEYTYRDILDEIAQATGSIIIINSQDEIELKYPTVTGENLNEEYLKDINVKFGQKFGPINSIVLSRSAESDNVYLRDEESVQQNGLCEVKIKDNQLMNFNDRSDYLEGILNALDGLYFYINDFTSTGIGFLEVGDLYNVEIEGQEYQCLMLNDEIEITGGLQEFIHTDLPEESETDYTKADKTDRRINETYLIVDKQNQTITSVVSNVTEQNQKISRVEQTVNELNSKISDIADITTSQESSYATVSFTGINQSEPIRVEIKPLGTNISYLYPRDNLYPSDTLFMPDRILRFKNTSTNEIFDYELPTDILYYDSSNYDEFILDYDSQTCVVNKKVGYNADGTTYVLSTPTTQTFTYPTIELTDGDYEVSIPGYNSAYLFVRLMAQNIYTTQFATKAEVNSKITQTATNINLSVDSKLSNYSTTTQMNSAIDVKANQITSSVSETYSTKSEVDTKLGNYSTTEEMNSAITQTASDITSTVSETYATKTTTNSLSTRISQTAKSISLTVTNEATASGIKITTTKEDGTTSTVEGTIEMTGLVKFTDLKTSGSTEINGANITTGIIKSSNYVSGSVGTSINLSTGAIDTKNFKVSSTGNITATGGTIGGFTLGSTKLYNGKSTLTASSAGVYIGTDGISLGTGSTFKVTSAGALTTTSGAIGGWNIDNTSLSKRIGNYSFEIRNDRASNEPALLVYDTVNSRYNFYVRTDGYLYARNADISGTISATSGSFSNCTITNCNINNTSAYSITTGKVGASEINCMAIETDILKISSVYQRIEIGDYRGQTVGVNLLDANGQPIELTFVAGLLIKVS